MQGLELLSHLQESESGSSTWDPGRPPFPGSGSRQEIRRVLHLIRHRQELEQVWKSLDKFEQTFEDKFGLVFEILRILRLGIYQPDGTNIKQLRTKDRSY